MELVKRQDTIIFKTRIEERGIFKGKLRYIQYSPRIKAWTAPATYSVFIDIMLFFKQNIRMDDAETAQWVTDCKVVLRRLNELQRGTQREGIRDVVLPDTLSASERSYCICSKYEALCTLARYGTWENIYIYYTCKVTPCYSSVRQCTKGTCDCP